MYECGLKLATHWAAARNENVKNELVDCACACGIYDVINQQIFRVNKFFYDLFEISFLSLINQ